MKLRSTEVVFATLTLLFAAMCVASQADLSNRKQLREAIEDPATFGKSVNFLGTLRGGGVVVDPTCSFEPGDLAPDDQCVPSGSFTALTQFNERDLGRVTLPGNSAKTNIYLIAEHFLDYEFVNFTAASVYDATLIYRPYITLESTALNDPRAAAAGAVDGKLDVNLSSARQIDRSLGVNERIHETENYTRALITGINKPFLVDSGLPADIVDAMFRRDLTIHLNIRGRTKHISGASFVCAIRIMGN